MNSPNKEHCWSIKNNLYYICKTFFINREFIRDVLVVHFKLAKFLLEFQLLMSMACRSTTYKMWHVGSQPLQTVQA